MNSGDNIDIFIQSGKYRIMRNFDFSIHQLSFIVLCCYMSPQTLLLKWYGMVWYGVVWCGVVSCSVV